MEDWSIDEFEENIKKLKENAPKGLYINEEFILK